MKLNVIFLNVVRILMGLLLLVSGVEKSISPYQNFLYVIQSYQFLPSGVDVLVAQVLPWIELIIGLFLLLGLWTRAVLIASACMFLGFISVVGQALLRGMNLSECGCFGELLHVPPPVMLGIDGFCLVMCFVLLKNLKLAHAFGLDTRFPS